MILCPNREPSTWVYVWFPFKSYGFQRYISNSHGTMQIPTCSRIEGDPTWVVARQVPRFEIQIICESGTYGSFFFF